jgi:hypothetical protein
MQRLKQLSSYGFLVLMLSLTACGNAQEQGSVNAMNLDNGQKQSFPEDGVPPGWGVCPDPTCTTPPPAPCQNLGPLVCAMRPDCRVRKLGCWVPGSDGTAIDGGSAPTEPAPAPGQPSDPTDPSIPMPPPPKCHYECVPAGPKTCDEITDAKTCSARPDCAWDPIMCAAACKPDGTCPPCPPAGICRKKAPAKCEDLGQNKCSQRKDCEWKPQPCPMMPCVDHPPIPGPGPGCFDCPAYCQPKAKPPVCLAIAPLPPVDCKGLIEPIYDPAGCLIGFKCVQCPAIPMVMPDCKPGQKPQPKYDDKGCLVGYICDTVCPPIPLGFPACEDGQKAVEKRDANGCVIGYGCVACPAIPMIAPNCSSDEIVVPTYNQDGCLTGYKCVAAPGTNPSKPAK